MSYRFKVCVMFGLLPSDLVDNLTSACADGFGFRLKVCVWFWVVCLNVCHMCVGF